MAEEWVEHSLDLARKADSKSAAAKKAHGEANKKL